MAVLKDANGTEAYKEIAEVQPAPVAVRASWGSLVGISVGSATCGPRGTAGVRWAQEAGSSAATGNSVTRVLVGYEASGESPHWVWPSIFTSVCWKP